MSRYSRQELFSGIGTDGQARISRSRVLLVGCGALGSSLAEMMTRGGVGSLTLVDRDYVEESNLQRQSLFDEDDARTGMPKALAAERKLRGINSAVEVKGLIADFTSDNGATLLSGADLVLDGTDNFETRFLMNDLCVREGINWVYGACVGAYGLALLVRPGKTPCLRCVLEELPPPGSGPTCDTAGVVSPIVHVIAGVQAAEAFKILAGRTESLLPGIVTVDLWQGLFEVMDLTGRSPSCPSCTQGRFDYLAASSATSVLCGRDAVQIRAAPGTTVDPAALARSWEGVGRVSYNAHLARLVLEDNEIVVFQDGRAIVKGARDAAAARTLYARYVGA